MTKTNAIDLMTTAAAKTTARLGGPLYRAADKAAWLETCEALVCIHSDTKEQRDQALTMLAALTR